MAVIWQTKKLAGICLFVSSWNMCLSVYLSVCNDKSYLYLDLSCLCTKGIRTLSTTEYGPAKDQHTSIVSRWGAPTRGILHLSRQRGGEFFIVWGLYWEGLIVGGGKTESE